MSPPGGPGLWQKLLLNSARGIIFPMKTPLLQFNEVSLLVKHFFLHRRGFACAGADFVLSYA